MKKAIYLAGGALGAFSMAFMGASSANAAGTAAGTIITNNVSVDYKVGTIDQTDVTASNNITVDRKINLVVERVDNTPTPVVSGASDEAVAFQVTNSSNATLDFSLLAEQIATGTAAGISGNDNFDVTGPLSFYLEDGTSSGFQIGEDTAITGLDDIAADEIVIVYVVADTIPLGRTDGDIASIRLTATALDSSGGALTNATSNTAGMDTVFADGPDDTGTTPDAMDSDQDDYVVRTANLTVTKSSSMVTATDWKQDFAVPEGTINYCITVENTGTVAASDVAITDKLPLSGPEGTAGSVDLTTYVGSSVMVGGTDCAGAGSPSAGTYTDNTEPTADVVSGTITSIPAGETRTLYFQATIK
ncbi:MAG: hypothetical protein ACK5NN_10545 [Sphingomonadaceae bacterium]